MKTPKLASLLPHVEATVRLAGAEIMKHYSGTTAYIKSDGSDVTDADYAAEKIILEGLQTLTPYIPIVSEERVAAGDVPDISQGAFWTVDALDGTTEFIKKTGDFAVAVSLVVDNLPVLGILYYPARGVLYIGAGPGTACRVDEDGTRTPLSAGQKPHEKAHVLVKPNANMDGIKGYLTKHFNQNAQIATKPGSALTSEILEGLADMAVVYPSRRNGRTAFWDVAPGHAIVEAAGGRVEGLDGQPLTYDSADLQVPPHIAISPARAHTKNVPPH